MILIMADELERRFELRLTGLDFRKLKDKLARLFDLEGGELTGPSKRPQRVKTCSFSNYRGPHESLGRPPWRWQMSCDDAWQSVGRSIAGKSSPVNTNKLSIRRGPCGIFLADEFLLVI